MAFRDDREALEARVRAQKAEIARLQAELEAVRASLEASEERARMFEAEADRLRGVGASRRRSKVGFDTWAGAIVFGFAAGFGAALFVFMLAMGR